MTASGRELVDIPTYLSQLDSEMDRVMQKPDVELGSLQTYELRTVVSPQTSGSGSPQKKDRKYLQSLLEELGRREMSGGFGGGGGAASIVSAGGNAGYAVSELDRARASARRTSGGVGR